MIETKEKKSKYIFLHNIIKIIIYLKFKNIFLFNFVFFIFFVCILSLNIQVIANDNAGLQILYLLNHFLVSLLALI